jgi:hypothetical protein
MDTLDWVMVGVAIIFTSMYATIIYFGIREFTDQRDNYE